MSAKVRYARILGRMVFSLWLQKPEAYANNERLSAKVLWQWVRRYAPGVFEWRNGLTGEIAVAASMIMATRQHRIDSDWLRQDALLLEDTRLFLDADLAILAAGEHRVQAYDEAIAQEWGNSLTRPPPRSQKDALRPCAHWRTDPAFSSPSPRSFRHLRRAPGPTLGASFKNGNL